MKLTYSLVEACNLLSIDHDTLIMLATKGELKILRIGRERLISAEALKDLINKLEYSDEYDDNIPIPKIKRPIKGVAI